MKKTIKNIIIYILINIVAFLGFSFISDKLCEHTYNQAKLVPITASNTIKAPSGDTNDSNIFKYMTNMYSAFPSTWEQIENYYISNSEYVFNGVQINKLVPVSITSLTNYAYVFTFSQPVPAGYPLTIVTNIGLNISSYFPNLKISWKSANNPNVFKYTDLELSPELTNANKSAFEPSDNEFWYHYYTSVCPYPSIEISVIFGEQESQEIQYDSGSKYFNEYGIVTVYQGLGNSNQIYELGLTQGYDNGYNVGYDSGYNLGFNDGYDQSTADGVANPENIFYTIWSILTTFGDLLLMFFNTPVWGDLTLGFVFIVIPFGFSLVQKVINIIIKLVGMLTGG